MIRCDFIDLLIGKQQYSKDNRYSQKQLYWSAKLYIKHAEFKKFGQLFKNLQTQQLFSQFLILIFIELEGRIPMSRCQHNQKITKFCVSPSCTHSGSGGCEYCFKRHHCHIGQAKALKETQVLDILKELTAFEDKKAKIRPLKEAIYNYFNIIKGQLSTYVDCISSDLLNRITYPYIRNEGSLNIVKKLKHKQYNKLTTEEMIRLTELRVNNPPEKLQISEVLAYFDQTQEVNKKVLAINNLYKMFEKEAQDSYLGEAIMSVSIYYKKIMEIIEHIDTQKNSLNKKYQENHNKKEALKLNLQKIGSQKKQEQNNIEQPRKNQVQFQYDTKLKNNQDNTSKRPSIQTDPVPEGIEKQNQWSGKKQPRQRKVSIDSRCNDLIGRSRLKTFEQKQKQILERKQKLEEMMNKKDKKQTVSSSSQSSKEKLRESEASERFKNQSLVESNVKSTKSNDQNNEMGAHTLLPQGKDDRKLYEQFQAVEKKTLKIPVNVIQQNAEQECQSPILKLKKNEKHKPGQGSSGFQLGLFKVQPTQQTNTSQSEETHSEPIQKAAQVSSQSSSQSSDKENAKPDFPEPREMNVTEKQASSIHLLAQSLKLSAKKAIPLLQAALKYAPHNFSAAQYLSYLFLEQNKPKECLKVCNEALKQISGEPNSIEISVHLFNNKAAALNLLGRFSESIPVLQKCIQVKKKDILYKNLGDAYFNLGINEKAMINYENALVLNDDNHEALYNLGVCLYLQKNYDSSKLKVQRALMLDHDNQSYLELYKQIGIAMQQERMR